MSGAAEWLVADVGATNARFCRAGEGGLVGQPVHLQTAEQRDSGALVAAALGQLQNPAVAAVALAVAGPVSGGRGELTNGTLEFDAAALSRDLGCRVIVVNDFQALAQALPDLHHLVQIGGGEPPRAVKAVLGPGSGLGMGVLAPVGDGWQVLASEGGHGDLAPGTPLETEILGLLQQQHGHVSWEMVLSGPGLVRLYGAVCRIWGSVPEELLAEEITGRGATASDPVCHQTLEVFFSLLGGAAGNLALTVCAEGGVYIGGGIVPDLVAFAQESPLRRRFEERGPMSELVRKVPLYLICDPDPGLSGALACLRHAVR